MSRRVYTCGVECHVVLDGVPDPHGKGRFGGRTPSQNMQLQIAAATGRIETSSDSAFSQIILVLGSIITSAEEKEVYVMVCLSVGRKTKIYEPAFLPTGGEWRKDLPAIFW